tara:strand:- start:765 stop:971 length:207 start_codon:yes stop_codon:yes gene_type:complete
MKIKEIYSVNVQIVDRGITFPLSKEIEVHPPIHRNVKAFLDKNRYAMDLTTKFSFEITSSKFIGVGTL